MKNELKYLLLQLKQNPIFRMSLTSKELFHSNFWAWMIEVCPETLKIFYPEYNQQLDGIPKIYREKSNLDLIALTERKLVVIESLIFYVNL